MNMSTVNALYCAGFVLQVQKLSNFKSNLKSFVFGLRMSYFDLKCVLNINWLWWNVGILSWCSWIFTCWILVKTASVFLYWMEKSEDFSFLDKNFWRTPLGATPCPHGHDQIRCIKALCGTHKWEWFYCTFFFSPPFTVKTDLSHTRY